MNQSMQVLTSSESVEWYTPEWLVELCRDVLGGIDLDPASSRQANETVKAKFFISAEQDGLSRSWFGRVFLNPPYSRIGGKSSQEVWSQKLVGEYMIRSVSQAILLTKAALGYKWFESLFAKWPVVLLRERVYFVRDDGYTGQDKRASALFYFGENVAGFEKVFRAHGRVILPFSRAIIPSVAV